MLWRLPLSVLLGMATIAHLVDSNHSLRAAEPPGRVEAGIGESLMLRWGAVQFRLVLGRLELDPPRHRNGSKTEERLEPMRIWESFTVTASRGIPSLHYTCRTPTRETILDIVDADRVHLRSDLLEADERLSLTQPDRGPLRVHLRAAGTEQIFHSASWLHLQSTHPELFNRHLEPLLASVLPDLSLQQLRQEAMENLFSLASHALPPSQDELLDLVGQLYSRPRRQRDQAHAQLVDYGIQIVPFLDQLPRRELQQEQRLRIDAIRRQLCPKQSDSPAGVARWLIADPIYWNAIAADFNPEQTVIANQHLMRIQGEGLIAATDGPTRVAQTPESSNRK